MQVIDRHQDLMVISQDWITAILVERILQT